MNPFTIQHTLGNPTVPGAIPTKESRRILALEETLRDIHAIVQICRVREERLPMVNDFHHFNVLRRIPELAAELKDSRLLRDIANELTEHAKRNPSKE